MSEMNGINEIKETIELVNSIAVKHIRPLMRNLNPEAPTESIVISQSTQKKPMPALTRGSVWGAESFTLKDVHEC